jgi:hypothetical protein
MRADAAVCMPRERYKCKVNLNGSPAVDALDPWVVND